jgi:hypothetical protein
MNRTYNNLIAVLIVVLILSLMLLLNGCTIYRVKTVPGKSVTVGVYSTRSFQAPELHYEREGENASFSFGADSATQEGIGDVGSLLLNMNSYCKAYPVMCTGSRNAPEYTPEIIRRAEVYCRAYPAQCNE